MAHSRHSLSLAASCALALSLLVTACNKTPAPSSQSPASAPAPAVAQAPPQAAPEPVPQPPPVPRVVPAGTSLGTRISSALGSKQSKDGDTFTGSLTNSVRLHDDVVIPAGSTVHGVVITAHSAGKFKGAASLSLKLVSVVVHGHSHPIATNVISNETKGKGKRTGAMIGGGAGDGALIGGIAGGGKGALIGGAVGAGAGTAGAAFTGNNRDISYPAESVLAFHLRSSLDLGPAPAPEAPAP